MNKIEWNRSISIIVIFKVFLFSPEHRTICPLVFEKENSSKHCHREWHQCHRGHGKPHSDKCSSARLCLSYRFLFFASLQFSSLNFCWQEKNHVASHGSWRHVKLKKCPKILFQPSCRIWCEDSEYVNLKIGPRHPKKLGPISPLTLVKSGLWGHISH